MGEQLSLAVSTVRADLCPGCVRSISPRGRATPARRPPSRRRRLATSLVPQDPWTLGRDAARISTFASPWRLTPSGLSAVLDAILDRSLSRRGGFVGGGLPVLAAGRGVALPGAAAPCRQGHRLRRAFGVLSDCP
jgi:hypothetical protein